MDTVTRLCGTLLKDDLHDINIFMGAEGVVQFLMRWPAQDTLVSRARMEDLESWSDG